MALPLVLLFGRTNVGKSTLFNRLSRSKTAVVYDQPGVTRDFIVTTIDDRFRLADSGGLFGASNEFTVLVEARIWEFLKRAAVIVWVLDGRQGLTNMDVDLSQKLRSLKQPKILVINKIDKETDETNLAEFYQLGWKVLIPISAEHGFNINALKEAIIQALPDVDKVPEIAPLTARFALVGRPNVGKSSLTNALLKEERVLVSEIAGTTRDAIECPFIWRFKSGQADRFILVDTAGIRKKTATPIEFYASVRMHAALKKVDMAVLLLDILTGPTEVDKMLMREIYEMGKGCILAINKWDMARKQLAQEGRNCEKFQQDFLKEVRRACPFTDAPVVFVSAKTQEGLEGLLKKVKMLQSCLKTGITTGFLNRCLQALQLQTPPTSRSGKIFKIYYAVQKSQKPFTLKVFCNRLAWMPLSYQRFLENKLRIIFRLYGCPLRWEWVEKRS